MFNQSKPPLRTLLRQYGVGSITVVITFLAMIASVLITIITLYVVEGELSVLGLLLAALIPAILAPIFSGRNFQLIYRLDLAEERLHLLTITDELTQTYNRRYFFERVAQEFSRARRHNHPLSIALIDFDDFKEVNDQYGHLAGDAALRHVSEVCRNNIREADVFARYGGDEFVFLFPETDAPQALECLERILDELTQNPLQYGDDIIKARVSAGIASLSETINNEDELLREADSSLYSAKNQGGHQVNSNRT